jgi:hypothetical protein
VDIYRHPMILGAYVGCDPDIGLWVYWLPLRNGWRERHPLPAELGSAWHADLEQLSPDLAQYVISLTGAPSVPA